MVKCSRVGCKADATHQDKIDAGLGCYGELNLCEEHYQEEKRHLREAIVKDIMKWFKKWDTSKTDRKIKADMAKILEKYEKNIKP